MKIEHIEGKNNGVFIAESEGKEAGRMAYTHIEDSLISIDHTIVEKEFGGQGIGQKLVMNLADFARNNKLKVESECDFAQSVFKKTEEIQDVWKG